MFIPGTKYFAVDYSRSHFDRTFEIEFEVMPNGQRVIHSIRSWKHELELTANKESENADSSEGKRYQDHRG